MSTLAVIPARGASKRLPRKNILPFRGRPMIAWTVHAALESRLFDTVLVTTDDDEIAACATLPGTTLDRRPAHLATDNVPLTAVLTYILENSGARYDNVCLLMPNCPLRDEADIAASFEHFRSAPTGATMSVVTYDWRRPEWALLETDGYIHPASAQDLQAIASRDYLMCPSGAIRWVHRNTFLHEPTFYPERLTGFEMPWHRAIDIDEATDLELASCVGHAIDSGFRFADDR